VGIARADELPRAGDERADVGRDDARLGVGDARHVAIGVGEVAEGEGMGLADDAQMLVDADVAALVAAGSSSAPPSRYSLWARTPIPDELQRLDGPPRPASKQTEAASAAHTAPTCAPRREHRAKRSPLLNLIRPAVIFGPSAQARSAFSTLPRVPVVDSIAAEASRAS
jgi:hypothetical protein